MQTRCTAAAVIPSIVAWLYQLEDNDFGDVALDGFIPDEEQHEREVRARYPEFSSQK